MKKKLVIVIAIIIIVLVLIFIGINIGRQQKNSELKEQINQKNYSLDERFYLENGKLYIVDDEKNIIQVPGDFSQMSISDYPEGTYQAKTNIGGVYFYYRLDGKIYLVRSENLKNWDTKELTAQEIGVPSNAKIKYIRIYGSFGYIFYINENGEGKILKSTTKGNYWNKIETDIKLNDKSELKFLNEFGMVADGYLTVPNEDDTKCDLYEVEILDENIDFKKIDATINYETTKQLDYYYMPTYYNNVTMISIEVGESKEDANPVKFVVRKYEGIYRTEEEHENQMKKEIQNWEDFKTTYSQMAENLDNKVFLTDFENYKIESKDIRITGDKAKEVAQKGFEESAKRITSEGINDTYKEDIRLEEVFANNYFTRKYNEADKKYTKIRRPCYVFTKENDVGNGVSVYVDMTTGLIIGGEAFGD